MRGVFSTLGCQCSFHRGVTFEWHSEGWGRRDRGDRAGVLGIGRNVCRALRSASVCCVEGNCVKPKAGWSKEAGEVGGGQTPRAMDDLLKSFNLILRKIWNCWRVFFKLWWSIQNKIYNFNHFEVYSSVALSVFTLFSSHHTICLQNFFFSNWKWNFRGMWKFLARDQIVTTSETMPDPQPSAPQWELLL